MNSILLLLIGSLVFLLLLAVGVLIYYRRLNSEQVETTSKGSSNSEVTLSENYLKKLEKMLQDAFEGAARNAAANLEKEFKSTLGELSNQNDALIASVKGFEEKFMVEFQASVGQIQSDLLNNLSGAVQDIDAKSKEMVAAVEALETTTKSKIEESLSGVAGTIQNELSGTGADLKAHLKEVAVGSIQEEVAGFKSAIEEAKTETVRSLTQIYKDTEEQKKALEEKMYQEVQGRREKLITELDERINSVIVQFLIENLGNSLDLNDQQEYIFKMLEENKEELKKEIHG